MSLLPLISVKAAAATAERGIRCFTSKVLGPLTRARVSPVRLYICLSPVDTVGVCGEIFCAELN